jgi:sugar phosphate isomerase/epimerase
LADYKINNIFQGGYSSLDPNKSYSSTFTGYRVPMSDLGISTDPRTANQIKEVSDKLSSGLKEIDLTLIQPKMVELVSKEQMQDIKRLSDLTGIGIAVHGPVMDTIGINQQGYDELNRVHSENVIINTLEKSYHVNPKGNVNVTFHTTEGVPGSEWNVIGDKESRRFKRLMAVDQESGRIIPIKEETLYYPSERESFKPGVEEKLITGAISEKDIEKEPKKYLELAPLEKGRTSTPESRLHSHNHTQWDDSINQLIFNKERADEILRNNSVQIQHLLGDIQKGVIRLEDMTPTQKDLYSHLQIAKIYLNDTQQHVESLFHKAYKYGKEKDREKLKIMSNMFREELNRNPLDPLNQSRAVQNLMMGLKGVTPQMLIPIEDFAVEKSAQTFGNAAFAAFKKFKDNTPIISIENPPVGHALSTGEDLRNVIEGSRKVFVEKLIKEEHKSEKEAKKIAEKLIGATWDVGHINILRKQGFGKEDIIKESEKIRPYLKHVHLSDNFGLEHTELPMGMGNVPFKEIMQKLGKEGFEAKKLIEAGDWWQQQMNPIQASLEGLGTPIYANQTTPYWNQAPGFFQGYNSGLEGAYLPSQNYGLWGTYFSQLPTELGGSTQAQGSRMSGRGME